MTFGLIKWYDDQKGFGVILSTEEDYKETFLHISQWTDVYYISTTNEIPVIFNTALQRNKISAVNCHYFKFKNDEHWINLLSLYGKSDNLILENKTINIIELTLNGITDNFDFAIIENKISELFNSLSDDVLINESNIFFRIAKSSKNILIKDYLSDKFINRLAHSDPQIQISVFKDHCCPLKAEFNF